MEFSYFLVFFGISSSACFWMGVLINYSDKLKAHYGNGYFIKLDGSLQAALNLAIIIIHFWAHLAVATQIQERWSVSQPLAVGLTLLCVSLVIIILYLLFRPAKNFPEQITALSKRSIAIVQSVICMIIISSMANYYFIFFSNHDFFFNELYDLIPFLFKFLFLSFLFLTLGCWSFWFLLQILYRDLEFKRVAFLQGQIDYGSYQNNFYTIPEALIEEHGWRPDQFPDDRTVSYDGLKFSMEVCLELPRSRGFQKTNIKDFIFRHQYFAINERAYLDYLKKHHKGGAVPKPYREGKTKRDIELDEYSKICFARDGNGGEIRFDWAPKERNFKDLLYDFPEDSICAAAFLHPNIVIVSKPQVRRRGSVLTLFGW